MTVLNEIPFTKTFADYAKRIDLDKYGGLEEEIQELFSKAAPLVKPKAVYAEHFVEEKHEDTVVIGGAAFTSRILRKNVESAERVFCYIATCGRELEDFSLNPGDFMEQFLIDELKELALQCALEFLQKHLIETFHVDKIASMNPGSGDVTVWPIEQQLDLFSLLGDPEASIGVKLTDSYLMIPNKTVSGIIFPTEVGFRACQVCTRENCPNRKAPYGPSQAELARG